MEIDPSNHYQSFTGFAGAKWIYLKEKKFTEGSFEKLIPSSLKSIWESFVSWSGNGNFHISQPFRKVQFVSGVCILNWLSSSSFWTLTRVPIRTSYFSLWLPSSLSTGPRQSRLSQSIQDSGIKPFLQKHSTFLLIFTVSCSTERAMRSFTFSAFVKVLDVISPIIG